MGVRFRKSKKIMPGVRLNVGKKGVGIRVGGKHGGVSFGPTGTRASASIPGTGISYSSKLGVSKNTKSSSVNRSAAPSQKLSCPTASVAKPPLIARTWVLIIGGILIIGGLGNIGSNAGAAIFGIVIGCFIVGGGFYLRRKDPFIANYGKIKKALSNPQIARYIKIFDESLALIMETRDPKTFFGRHSDLINAVQAIERLTNLPCIHGATPGQVSAAINADTEEITNLFLARYAEEVRLKAFELTRGRKQKVESFKLITSEFENQMSPECIAYRDKLYADMMAKIENI